jgi:hypothetical protein
MILDLIRTMNLWLDNKKGMTGILKYFLIGSAVIIILLVMVMCNTIMPTQPLKKP